MSASLHSARAVGLVLLLVAACAVPPPAPRDPPPPNIVVFLVDDLGRQDVSLPLHTERTPLNERYRTPNVERLAARGVSFTNAYASAPVCTPTRTSLLTGVSPARSRITYWILHADRDTSAAWEGLRPPEWDLDGLQPGDVTLPALLSSAGYRTIHVGKAHLGGVGSPGEDPRALGFDVNVAGHGAGAPASYLASDGFARGVVWDVPGLERWHGTDRFLTDVLAVEASEAVRAAVADDVPFFLHMAPYAVHTPITANPRLLDHYPDLPPREAAYATMVESVDDALGVLLDLLEELDVAGETVVVFTSDNGGLSAHGRDGTTHAHNAPLRSGKGSYYEGGVRVPAVVAWPGRTTPGTRDDTPIVSHDLFPTLAAAAGATVPADHAARVDGVDLGPLLDGEALPERDLVWHQPHHWGVAAPGVQPFSALRRGRWKLVHRHADGGLELYDLATDPGEARDLAAEQPGRAADLARRLADALRAADARRSVDTRTGAPVPWPDGRP